MNATEETELLGWQSSPNKRGTIDIIWACTSTIFVCVWVMFHLNVPSEKEKEGMILLRKMKWFTMAMLAPELLMLFAGGQWAAARRSVKDMRALGVENWTMVHAFYAESGGFTFLTKEPGDKDQFHFPVTSFPVTSRQIHYLLALKYIDAPSISEDEIRDKSKADSFAKVIAAAQSVWFVVQITARGIEDLSVTLLELSTVCLMTCTASTLFFWFYKPLDVRSTTVIPCDHTIADILVEAGYVAKNPYRNTPLDFCDPLEYSSPQFPGNHLWGELKRPLPRIPNDRDSLLHNWSVLMVLSVPTAAFGTLQLIAWNFTFPTKVEMLLWRWTCVGGCVVLGVGCFLEAAAIVFSKYTLSGMQTFNNYKSRWPWCLSFYGAGFLYFFARVIVITEVVISLRALPPSAFETVNWTSLLPHV